ncbi:uncharacterized mitochondrial protein AtMg00810-like [Humulus lupulus]|uniref:uncharacterized mitochondrial protein AtMg00810-like n=1 Tax=Humulus lupulus TaxID=3486 RepID=UPI002B404577|nr:uncharacterized mitochondrial protein AtMg00810-like [Humulus lupulus]
MNNEMTALRSQGTWVLVPPPSDAKIVGYDIIITGSSSTAITALMTYLHGQFAVKDLGDLHYFLGLEVHRSSAGLHLSQTKYFRDVLSKSGLLDSKPMSTPLALGSLSLHDGGPLPCSTEYRSLVGALQYCTLTRPDLAFTVNKLCQFIHSPTDAHMQAVKHVLRYLKGTSHLGLLIQPNSDHVLYTFTDTDWASCPDD